LQEQQQQAFLVLALFAERRISSVGLPLSQTQKKTHQEEEEEEEEE
jgi:hypothetical protein